MSGGARGGGSGGARLAAAASEALPVEAQLIEALLIGRLHAAGLSVGTAESLTGGLVAAALTSVPGASRVVRGGVIAYTHETKSHVLGVDADLLRRRGAVHPDVAGAMAEGVCRLLDCDLALATTGVAGPDPSDGEPVGTVFVAVCLRSAREPGDRLPTQHVRLALQGDRAEIRAATVDEVIALALRVLDTAGPRHADGGPG